MLMIRYVPYQGLYKRIILYEPDVTAGVAAGPRGGAGQDRTGRQVCPPNRLNRGR